MKAVNIFLLCILGAALLSTVLCNCSNGPDECCFQFFRNRLNKNLITSYYRTDARCATNGVILITRRARRICVDSKEEWVQNIVKSLEMKTL
ncbi:C-C motif chemokine 3-like isoform X3 [Poecilia formosa]|uniref:C-C motif chemokine 3-like isoform X3 n=1 Tax=Poecilia formosa TaxID=48698 RepID=UPI0007B90100|nr:PREDICTED: C-C motif chemokine 3-like isoform X3 [Poecilia formosa]